MGLTTAGYLALASLVVGAAGTGYSVYSQNQAAKTQDTFALLNAQMGREQGQLQARLAMAQANIQAQTAQANERIGMANANAIRGDAEARTRASEQNIINTRADQERFQSTQRSMMSASGLVDSTGSPLDLLADTASAHQMQLAEMQYQTELERRQLFREADMTALGARMSGLDAGMETLKGMSQAAAARMSSRQATLNGYAGAAQADAMRSQAVATGISGAGSAIGSAYGFSREGSLRFGTKQTYGGPTYM